MAPKKKLQVFVSSTYSDLREERQAAVEAILTAGHIPAGMELFAAGDQSQMDVIKRWINESDVFLLILGGRYGSVEPKSKKSYIQLEYEYACEMGKALFAVVITEDAIEKKVKKLNRNAIEQKYPQKLEDFRKTVLSKVVRMWSDTTGIKLAILEKLPELSLRDDLVGWIRGERLPPYCGEWEGHVYWTDDWARHLINSGNRIPNFTPVNPRSEGTLYIYRSFSGVYKGFSTWTLMNDDTRITVAAVLASNFHFSADGKLTSCDVRAHSRRNISENAEYGPSPLYNWHFTEVSVTRISGTMITKLEGKETEVGSLLLERN
jgi:Domain of unknown function (DUF4062)